ncbi:MAG: hypothetical protein KF789_10915 [Bdellovibrionaceae bacterium]|nr:hypothetical protein [Pseudobdellovibrionaceae bacterium]
MTAKMALVTSLLLAVFAPARVGHLRFVQLTTPLIVSAEKSHPPYIAFNEAEKLSLKDPWDLMDEKEASALTTDIVVMPLAEKIVLHLEPLRLSREPARLELPGLQVASNDRVESPAESAWVQELPSRERLRLEQAQLKNRDLLIEEEESPGLQLEKTWRERAQEVIARTQASESKPSSVTIGSGTDEAGRVIQTERSVARVEVAPEQIEESLEIAGEFQLKNLAYINYPIEIRRRHEGIYEEKGSVELLESTYKIRVSGRTGEVVIRMRDQSNRIVGESSFPLSRFRQTSQRGTVRGPKVTLQPKNDIAGRAIPTSYASTKNSDHKTFAGVAGDAFMGASDIHVAKNGEFELNNIKKGSFSLVSMTAKDHARTSMLVAAGFRANIPLFPNSMMNAMKEIVSEQRKQNLNDPESSVIWGQVTVDGKAVSGVQVEVESVPGYEPIYFNEWMLPDPALKATSSNGTYAFVGVPEGLHAILGRRGDKYFSHQNVVVQKSAVALGNLETGHESEQAIFRVFDAFTGDPQPAEIVHQGVAEPLLIGTSGSTTALLGSVHRLSLSQVRPESPYALARYYSDDQRGYVHYPLIREDWISYMRAMMKIDDQPGTSVVVGFVTHEDFSVDALDPFSRTQIAYFDAAGRPAKEGTAGGGFVIFGLSEGVREILVTSGKTGEIATQTVASDSGALTVLRFQED